MKYGIARRARSIQPGDPRHGTYGGYANYSCRCDECREANRLNTIGYRYRRGLLSIEKAHALGWKGEEVE